MTNWESNFIWLASKIHLPNYYITSLPWIMLPDPLLSWDTCKSKRMSHTGMESRLKTAIIQVNGNLLFPLLYLTLKYNINYTYILLEQIHIYSRLLLDLVIFKLLRSIIVWWYQEVKFVSGLRYPTILLVSTQEIVLKVLVILFFVSHGPSYYISVLPSAWNNSIDLVSAWTRNPWICLSCYMANCTWGPCFFSDSSRGPKHTSVSS